MSHMSLKLAEGDNRPSALPETLRRELAQRITDLVDDGSCMTSAGMSRDDRFETSRRIRSLLDRLHGGIHGLLGVEKR